MKHFARALLFTSVIWIPLGSAAGSIDWKYWGDGRAEVSRYEGTIERYGQTRSVDVTWIFVTEPFSRKDRVKADEGKHPPEDIFQVVKLNDIRKFQTGIYPYHLMTSVFGEIGSVELGVPLPPTKLVFSGQEWCGTTFTEMKRSGKSAEFTEHSYFDGEADRQYSLKLDQTTVFEDALPLIMHQIDGDLGALAAQKKFTAVTSAMVARFTHTPMRKGEGMIEAVKDGGDKPEAFTLGKKIVKSRQWKITLPREISLRVWTEFEKPHRILKWERADGFSIRLVGSKRLPYWKMNQLGGEKALREIKGVLEP
jgi:hypothetical protein